QEDYMTRQRQMRSGTTDPVDPPAVAPWDVAPLPRDRAAEGVVRAWLEGAWPKLSAVRCDDEQITAVPLAWLVIITSSASYERIFSEDARVGLVASWQNLASNLAAGTLPPEKAAIAPKLIFNQQIVAVLTVFFTVVLWVIVLDMLRLIRRYYRKEPVLPLAEIPYTPTRLEAAHA
ncbi:MAG: hypothetical protein J0L97_00350, partial [Alphaproteobacteria bacterium]|nr:hypothetical protein [Alphaproteobacteria bacterium]